MEMIRRATEADVARIVEIARAAYIKYVPRMGRDPPPMFADFGDASLKAKAHLARNDHLPAYFGDRSLQEMKVRKCP